MFIRYKANYYLLSLNSYYVNDTLNISNKERGPYMSIYEVVFIIVGELT